MVEVESFALFGRDGDTNPPRWIAIEELFVGEGPKAVCRFSLVAVSTAAAVYNRRRLGFGPNTAPLQ